MRKITLIFIITVTLIFLAACGNDSDTIEKAMKDAKMNYDEILHVEELSDLKKGLVFYKHDNTYGVGLLEKVNSDWKWIIGSKARRESLEQSMVYNNLNQEVPMAYGLVEDENLAKISVITNNDKKEATIKEIGNSGKMWFILFDAPQNPPIEVFGYDKEDKIIFSY